jgi:hypothetical protein
MRTRIIVTAAVLGMAVLLGTSAAQAREHHHWHHGHAAVSYSPPVYTPPPTFVVPPTSPAPYRYSYMYYDWLRDQADAVALARQSIIYPPAYPVAPAYAAPAQYPVAAYCP